MDETPNTPTRSDSERADLTRLTGHGVIYRNGTRVGETDYDLLVTPRDQRSATYAPGLEPTEVPEITGHLLGSFYQSESLTGPMTLVLDDGRSLDFQVLQPDTNEIASLSSLSDAPSSRMAE